MRSHATWRAAILGRSEQKVLRISDNGQPRDVLITFYDTDPKVPALNQKPSEAEPAGFTVDIVYKSSPETVLFEKSFAGEKEARDSYQDIVKAVAEVEGLLRQQKTAEADAATERLKQYLKSNSTDVPVQVTP